MDLNNIDITKLPSDVRKTFRQLQVMYAEKKIQNKQKKIFYPLLNVFGPSLLKARIIDT